MGRRSDGERGVLAQDRPLELTELRTRLDPELVDQDSARLPVRLERLRLATGAVQSEDQLAPQPLAQRMAGNEILELGHELGMATELQVGVDPLLERGQPDLLETGDLADECRLIRCVGERRAPPEG